MRICITTTAFPRWQGDDRGAFIFQAAHAVNKKVHFVKVIAIHSPGAKTHEMMDGIEVIRPRYLPEIWEILQSEGGGLPVIWKKKPLARLALLPFSLVHTLATAYYSRDCDIIHANWSLSGMAAWAGHFLHQRPYIVTLQGSDIYQTLSVAWIKFLTRHTLNKAKKVLSLSQSLADTAFDSGLCNEKPLIVPNGVDTHVFFSGNTERKNILLFVGSLINRKGINFLIYAMPAILRSITDAQLIITGEGSLDVELKQLAHTLGLQSNITFLGKKTPDEIAGLMRTAKVFILPSLEEGLGVVLLEALASGTPCIGSRVGGIPDVVNDQNGRLVDPGEPEQIAQAAVELITSQDLWQQLSKNARRDALERFDWGIIADRLIEIYAGIIRNNK